MTKENIILIPGYNLMNWDIKSMYGSLYTSLKEKYNVFIADYDMRAKKIEDIFQYLDSFLEKNKIKSCSIICNSYGAYIGLRYLSEINKKIKVRKLILMNGLVHGSRLFRLYYYHDLLSKANTGNAFRDAVYDINRKYSLPKETSVLVLSGDRRLGKSFLGNIFQRYGILGLALLTFDLRTTDGVLSIDESTLEGYQNKIIHADHLSMHIHPETIEKVLSFLKS